MTDRADHNGKVAGSFFWQAINYALIAVMSVVFLMVTARLISKENFGVFAVVSVTVAIITQFSEIGIGAALVQRRNYNSIHISVAFWSALVVAVCLYLVIYLGSSLLVGAYGGNIDPDIMRVAGLAVVFSGASVVPQSIMMREFRFRQLCYANTVAYALGHLGLGLVLAIYGFGAWSLVIALAASKLLLCAFLWILNPTRILLVWRRIEARQVVGFGSMLTLARALNSIAENIDKLILAALAPMSALGVYERSTYVVRLPLNYIGHIVDAPLFSILSRSNLTNGETQNYFLNALSVSVVVGIFSSSYVILFSQPIVGVVLGPGWENAASIMSILGAIILVNLLARISDVVVRSTNKMYRSLPVKAMYVVLTGLGTVVGWRFGGVTGVAALVLVGSSLHAVFMLSVASRILGIGFKGILAGVGPGMYLALVFLAKTIAICYVAQHILGVNVSSLLFAGVVLTDIIGLIVIIRKCPHILGVRIRTLMRGVMMKLEAA